MFGYQLFLIHSKQEVVTILEYLCSELDSGLDGASSQKHPSPIPNSDLENTSFLKLDTFIIKFLNRPMSVPLMLLPTAISDLYADASLTGQLTLADRYGLMAAILNESTTEEERSSIDRLLRSLHRGRIQISDELSTVS